MNHDEATMKALAEEVRKVYRSSTDAPRLFRDYFGDFLGPILDDALSRKEEEIDELKEEIGELRDEVEELKNKLAES